LQDLISKKKTEE
jgi:hypothetical protein